MQNTDHSIAATDPKNYIQDGRTRHGFDLDLLTHNIRVFFARK